MLDRYRNPRSGDLKASELSSHDLLAVAGVREAGSVNMLNRGHVLDLLRAIEKDEEADALEELPPSEWLMMLQLMSITRHSSTIRGI